MRKNTNFEIVLAINKHVSEVKQATTLLHGAPGKLPSITPTECAERIIQSAINLQGELDRILSAAEEVT